MRYNVLYETHIGWQNERQGKMAFEIGDQIIYGSMGVCTVVDIAVPDLPGATRECYVLKPHYVANSKVYAPVEENPVKMRSLLTPEEVQSLIDDLPQIQAFPANKEKQELYNTYRSVIRSADSFLLAKLLKTLHEKKKRVVAQRKVIPSAEKEYFDTAEKMLYGEIAVALQMPIEEVEDYIVDRLGPEYTEFAVSVS